MPIGEFLRSELRELYRSTVTRERIESLDVLDYSAVQQVYEDHCARRAEHADLLFALLSNNTHLIFQNVAFQIFFYQKGNGERLQ